MGSSTFECTYVNYIELGRHKHFITTLLGCVTQNNKLYFVKNRILASLIYSHCDVLALKIK